VTLNGVQLTTPFVLHKQLMASAPAQLNFTLGSEPCVFGQLPPSKGGPKPFMPPDTPAMQPPQHVMDEIQKMAQDTSSWARNLEKSWNGKSTIVETLKTF